MILTAHQPCYLPWLGLFHKMALAEMFVCFDKVQYQTKGYNNRNQIWTPTGPQWLTVPVLTKGYRGKTMDQIEINHAVPWQRKHFRSLTQNYRKARYFDRYLPTLEDIYDRPWTRLCDLNDFMVQWFLGALEIDVGYRYAHDYQFQGTKSALVLEMCQQLGATTYIFGANGRAYADVGAFEQAGIRVVFQDYHHPVYSQFGGPFQSHLSVLDLLMHHGPEAKAILMEGDHAQTRHA